MDSKVSLNVVKNWQALCNDIVFSDIAPLLLQNQIITVKEYQCISSEPETTKTESLLLTLLKKNDIVLLKFGKALERDYSWLAEKIMEGCTKNIKQEDGKDEVDAVPVIHTDSYKTFENETTEDEKDLCMECDKTTEDEKDLCMEYDSLSSIHRDHLNNRINIKNAKPKRKRILKSRIKNKLKPKVQNSETEISSTTELVKPQLNEEVTDEVIRTVKNCSLLSKSWTTIAHSLGLTDKVHDIRYRVTLHDEDLNMCVVYLLKNWIEMSPQMATLSKLIEVLRNENFNRVADQLTEILYRKPAAPNNRVQ